ncbi:MULTISPECIES: polymer-forming cytoskeletal protein [Haloferacaceae]|uniref:Polymer-forming cytoskeletal protein n=1 Tax=Halorubrum glutamatedens TaxID=2707018 RepID=A0ABD5QNU0_9EURY|nr:polymer-forming cytoskeletal protein [Halobellus captivus]
MSFSHDRRGQSVVVGTVILFGFLILAMATYQVQFVPTENEEIEFEHSQQVERDFLDLRNDVLSAGTTGSARSTSIQLGTRYPQRTFFLNPPAASGTLETTGEQQFEIRNAQVNVSDGAHENVHHFWNNGTEQGPDGPVFVTRSIRYTPDYNEYRGAPRLVYENSLVAAEFGDRALPRSDQTVVRSDRVSLTAVSGNISENGIESKSVDSETISRGSRSIPIQGDGGNIVIVLPTAVSNASDLVDRLDVPAAKNVMANGDRVEITLNESETYRLGLSEISVDGSGETDPAYIVPVGGQNVISGQSVGVEVRDKYNNPVADAEVNVYTRTDSTSSETLRTNSEGRVYSQNGTVFTINEVSADGSDGERYERVEVTLLPISDGAGNVSGPRVYGVSASPSSVIQGGQLDLSATIDSVGNETTIRSGTPIQRVDVVAESENGSYERTSYDYDPDDTTRVYPFSETIDMDWEPGEYNVTVRGQDASGRWTSPEEEGEATITVVGGAVSSTVNFTVTDVAQDGNTQSFTFDAGDLGNNDAATIDLSDPQNGGVDYTNANFELIEQTNNNDAISYDSTTNTITFTKRGGGDGIVTIQASGIDVTGPSGERFTISYSDDNGGIDSDSFQIRSGGTEIATQDSSDDVSNNGDVVISDGVTIEGDVESQNGIIEIGQNTNIQGDIDANGDISIADGSTIEGEITSNNNAVSTGDDVTIEDDITANGDVIIGDDNTIDGDLTSNNGDIVVGKNTTINGEITASNQNITIMDGATVNDEISSNNGNIGIGENVTVNADISTDNGDVSIGANSFIDGDVDAPNGQVSITESATITGEVTEA